MRFPFKSLVKFLVRLPQRSAVVLVRLYQRTLSPDHGFFRVFFPDGFCKYQPSCSQYMHESLEKHGFVSGVIRGFWRIVRCNPCSKGGFNPVS